MVKSSCFHRDNKPEGEVGAGVVSLPLSSVSVCNRSVIVGTTDISVFDMAYLLSVAQGVSAFLL